MTTSDTALASGSDSPGYGDACGWRVLGEVAVEVGGTAGTLTGQRQRAVLAYLILHPNTNITVSELTEALWASAPPMTARNTIQRFIADIRRRLGPAAHRIQTTSSGYRLEMLDGESDVARARHAMEVGRDRLLAGDAAGASASFQSGLSEFRGQPLAGVGDVWFRGTSGAELDELRRSLREGSFEAGLALGLHHRLMEVLHRFANDNPHRESAWALLMLALYRSGRQHEALEAAKTLRRALLEDLGIDPSPTITDLIHRILNHARNLQLGPNLDANGDVQPGVWRSPLPSQLVRVLTSEVVGRDDELRLAAEAIDELTRGNPRVTLVNGEPGIGKTRLAAEFAHRADQRGAMTYYGRSDEDTAVPLGAWAEVLTDLVAANRTLIDGLALDTIAEDLHELVPELGGQDSATSVSLGGSETRRAALFRSVVQLLDGVSATQPIVIVLDDLQWAEASTTQLLRHVARNLRGPVWLIGLFRDTDVGEQHPVSDTVASLRREPQVDVLSLTGLDDDGTAELVQSLLPDLGSDDLADFAAQVSRETSGNPFFASEIVRDLIEARPDDESDSPTQPIFGETPLPDSVRQVVRQRVGRLGESVVRTLRTASVFGRHFDLRDLAAVCRHDEATVLADLETALDAALVSEAPGSPDRFSFEHDLVHHSLYLDLSESRRRRLHARCALALRDRMGAEGRTNRAGEIAGHFIEASDPALALETIDAIRIAASEAARRHDPDEAATLLSRAITLLESDGFVHHADAETAGALQRIRVSLLVERGTYLRNAGHPDFRDALLAAGRAAAEAGDIDAQVDAALANTRGLQTNIWEIDEERVQQLEAAVDALGNEQSSRRANLLASLASEKWHDEHRAESAVYRADSIALARQLGDPSTLANVLTRAARARNTVAPADEQRRLSTEMQSLVPLGHDFDPYLMVNLLRAIQNQALRDADPDLLMSTTDAIRAYAAERPLAKSQRAIILSDVLLAGLRGDGDEYLRLAHEASTLLEEMGDPEATITHEAHLFYGLFLLGRTSEVLDVAVGLAAERPHIDMYQAVAAHGSFLAGDHDDARRRLDAGLARGFGVGVDDYTVQALQQWADPAAGVGHIAASQELYALLSPHTGRLSGHVIHITQPVDLSLGRLCHALGRTSAALAHLDVSADIAERFYATWMAEQTDVSRARVLIDRGHDGDIGEARSRLTDTAVRAVRNNHPAVAAEATALLAQIA